MSAQVNVLAVMDAAVHKIGAESSGADIAGDLLDSRDAVAELIEADAEFDKANAAYNPLFAKGNKAHTYHDFIAAKKRREAAIARVQGGAA